METICTVVQCSISSLARKIDDTRVRMQALLSQPIEVVEESD